ncbi:uncharacterized protein THITE_2119566 [Thermothielavioides terrestris NRRL 8126]|uniref:Glutathione synthetase n=2 Tax=Thermothielavioides terrestris TaxID=2587410 RepID=G2RBY7_THETT|nr:uncharacterized protein THITE_2119566 [Thermothielavioides terrestris NRRL 8126]AEO69308.1 hypothetical protein THITE_2119566 [Thermothielavioides terrestris NRRL 8126]
MVHQDGGSLQIKQVEFNTIASSFAGLSAKTSLLHKHLARTEYPLLQDPIPEHELDLPTNESAKGLAAGLSAAFAAYGESALGHPTCVLFLVQDGERNIFDQRHLEYALQSSQPKPIPVFRLPFSQILAHTTIAPSSPGRQLLYHPPHNPALTFEAAVVYLRAGYGPSDYPSPSAWEARYQIERSAAIACPSVLTQLAGMKKVQQVLAAPEAAAGSSAAAAAPSALRRFVPDEAAHAAIAKTFTNIYPLDSASAAGREARRLATDPAACQRYVMKPQREGGGNNVYRAAIPRRLAEIPEEHWGAYILMEIIEPPPVTNTILRNGRLEHGGVICELGVYGACLWDNETGRVLHNEEAGYLLRTKGDQSEEGGVAAGYGCMDSCRLV